MPAPVTTLVFRSESSIVLSSSHIPALISRFGSSAVLSSYYIFALAASAALSLPCHAFASCCGISALLLPLLLLGPPLLLRSSPLKTFQQFLLDESWRRMSTSLAKPLCLFPALGVYNPDNNNGLHNSTNTNKLKWDFDIAFINSRLLAGNYDQKEVNLSFAGWRCLNAVKFNRWW